MMKKIEQLWFYKQYMHYICAFSVPLRTVVSSLRVIAAAVKTWGFVQAVTVAALSMQTRILEFRLQL